MRRITAIAFNTIREAIRDRILYTIFFFAALVILSSWAIGQLSLHEEARLTRDLGLGGIAFFGAVLAIVVGVNLIHREIDRRTIYSLLARPVRRSEFILGRFIGLALVLSAQLALMAAVLWLALRLHGARFDALLARAVLLLWLQSIVVAALAVLCSTLSTPLLSGLMTAGLLVIGRSLPDLLAFVDARLEPGPARRIARVAIELLPDLHLFFVSGQIVDGKAMSVNTARYVDWAYVAWAGGYACVYSACVLLLAMLIFSRRDLV